MLTVEDEPIVALDLCLRLTGAGGTAAGAVASGLEAGVHAETREHPPRQDRRRQRVNFDSLDIAGYAIKFMNSSPIR
jgi:hypothetical protein